MPKESKINLFITLDEKKMPEKIEWEADDAGFSGKKESQTMMLSLWDKKEKMTYSIDIWTKEMSVEDMRIHFHQLFLKMADTFERATQSSDIAEMIRNFSSDFAKRTGLKDFPK
jgi:gliding motility-associated protein GldC